MCYALYSLYRTLLLLTCTTLGSRSLHNKLRTVHDERLR